LNAIAAQNAPPLDSMSPEAARKVAIEGLKMVDYPLEEVARVEDLRIPAPHPVAIRIFTPAGAGPFPALVYFHGGGWVVCNLDTHDHTCRAIARRAEAVVVAVDYRLAPEHKFPAAVDDCYAATEWVAANAARLSVDPRRIAVGGDSAGGNLSTVMCLKSRDEGGPPLALQVLVYPVTNLAALDTPSYQEFAENHYMTRADMQWFRSNYLARPEDAQNPYASPLLAANLRGLPPALVITGECDTLRDEGEAYARRMSEAGVEVTSTRYNGMVHPFYSFAGALPQGRRSVEQVAAAVRFMGGQVR